MTHGYSLRSNAKGRQRHQSADDTDDQVGLDIEAGTVDPRPTTPDTPRAAHKSLAPTPPTEEGQHQHSRSIATSSSATTLTRYRAEGPPETWEEIHAARKREDARRIAEAVRIRREQIVRGYDSELRALRARIVALRSECEVQVERVTKEWERAWAIERGEVVVVVEDGEEGSAVGYSDWEDARGEVAVDEPNEPGPTKTSLTTDDQQSRWPSQSASCWSRSESNFRPPPPLRKTQQQQQQQQQQVHMHMGTYPLLELEEDERGPGKTHAGRRLPRNQGRHGRTSHSSPPRPQPLQRRPAQLMVVPTLSHGLHMHTYGTTVPDPEICFGGTDGDKDSKMDMGER